MFEIVNPLTVESMMAANGETEHPAHSHIEVANPPMTDGSSRKIVLPAGSDNPASDRSHIITTHPAPACRQVGVPPLRIEPASVLDGSP